MAKSKAEYWLTSDGLTLLAGWARDGLTDEQIAHNCGIKRQTLYDWKNKYPDISDTLKKNKEIADYEVENALFKRALGYSYDEVTREKVKNPLTGEFIMTETKRVTKEVQPDVGAIMAWLKNRKPDKWRDRPQDKSDEDEGVIIYNDAPKWKKDNQD